MSWKSQQIVTPIPSAVSDAVSPVVGLVSSITPILSAITTLLNTASVFLTGTVDPFKTLAASLITDLENLNNDLFGTGFYTITVNAYEIEGVRRYDSLGFPLLTPAEAIEAAVQSFDDLGDGDAPVFSNSSTVTGFGILATANSIDQFSDLINRLLNVFNDPNWKFIHGEIRRFKTVASTITSVKPDWTSKRLNSYEQLGNLQLSIIELTSTLKGYLTVADTNIQDLISIIALKTSTLQRILNDLNTLINSIQRANGLYVLDIPPTVGGNNFIKRALRDPVLEDSCLKNGYTILTLFVGGGPSLQIVNTIREIIT